MNLPDAYDPIRALQAAWKLVTRSPVPLLIGGIALSLFDNNLSGLFQGHDHGGWHFRHKYGEFFLAFGCCSVAGFFLSCWISLGLANCVEQTVTFGNARFSDLFDARRRFFEMVLVRIMVILGWLAACVPAALVVAGGVFAVQNLGAPRDIVVVAAILALLAYTPVFFYIVLGLALAHLAVAIEGLQPTQAVQRSWSIARGNRLRLLVYWLALTVFSLAGLCLCCVGVFFTSALMQVALNESYLAIVKPDDYARSWLATGNAPPPVPPTPATIG